MVNDRFDWGSKRLGDMLMLANGIVLLVLINLVASTWFFRIDLTEEKRFQIKDPTREILKNLDDDVFIEVYLEGELNASFRRFRNSIRETLEEFRIQSGNKVHYSFTDPAAALGQKAQAEFMTELASKGIQPTRVIDNENGQRMEKVIFPGAIVSYGSAERGVQLLKGNKAASQLEEINQSIEGVEFEIASAIVQLTRESTKKIGWVTGHGELDGAEAISFQRAINEMYELEPIELGSPVTPQSFDALVIARPTQTFSDIEKLNLDQFIMKGGNVLFLIDKLTANMDSASQQSYFAFPYSLGLDDQLFKYGVRLNMDLVQDRVSGKYPVVTGQTGTRPQIQLIDWPFFPLVNHYSSHPITNNLDAVVMRFVSSIDTVKAQRIRKTPLMFTSEYSRKLTAPVDVSIQTLRQPDLASQFTVANVPVAYLLEGEFTSVFKNRFLPDSAKTKNFIGDGKPAKLIVVADGDLAANVVNPRTGQPQALGFDPFTNTTFASRDLLMNMISYLVEENGLIQVRSKEIKIRPLDKEKIAGEKTKWQFVNIAIPLILLFSFAAVRAYIRKKRFAEFYAGEEK